MRGVFFETLKERVRIISCHLKSPALTFLSQILFQIKKDVLEKLFIPYGIFFFTVAINLKCSFFWEQLKFLGSFPPHPHPFFFFFILIHKSILYQFLISRLPHQSSRLPSIILLLSEGLFVSETSLN